MVVEIQNTSSFKENSETSNSKVKIMKDLSVLNSGIQLDKRDTEQ
jgi:hypothetical protein